MPKVDRSYVSEIDKILTKMYAKTQSESQKKERGQGQRIAELRDDPNATHVTEAVWQFLDDSEKS